MTRYGILIKWSEDIDPWELSEVEEEFTIRGLFRESPGYYVSDHEDVVKVILAFQRTTQLHLEFFKKYAGLAKMLRITDVNDLTGFYK